MRTGYKRENFPGGRIIGGRYSFGGPRATPREKLIKIGAKGVCHGRYLTFQMAEVAIPRFLFEKILRLIMNLRPLEHLT